MKKQKEKLKQNKDEYENLFNKKEFRLTNILLELEKELRDRTDISSTLFGMIFAGGTFLLLSSISQRREILEMFVIIMPIIVIYKFIIIQSIAFRIREIQSELKINQSNQIWNFIRFMYILIFVIIGILVIFLRITTY